MAIQPGLYKRFQPQRNFVEVTPGRPGVHTQCDPGISCRVVNNLLSEFLEKRCREIVHAVTAQVFQSAQSRRFTTTGQAGYQDQFLS